MAILAIDQGTSGTKAIVVDDDGIVAVAERALRPRYLPGGGVEQDPQELLRSVLESGREAAQSAGRPLSAVALANQGETVLAWDPDSGTPLTTAVSWQDRRAESVCAELAEHAEEIRERTALQLDPYFSAPKMAWLRRNLTREGVVTTTDTWIVHQLTGEFVTDTSTASRSLLLGIDEVAWDERLIELFGLTGERLPRLVASDEIVGTTTAFGAEIPVAGLIVDQQAALLAEGCFDRGTAKCTYGTGAFLLVNLGDRAARFDNGLTTSVAWTLRGRTSYCADGQVYTAASAVRWMCDLGLIETAADLDVVAADSSDGVLCAPSFAGLAAPWWRPDAGAFLSGMTLSTGRPQIVRAVLEGISAQVAELAALSDEELGAPLVRLRVDGGLTRSRVLMQSQADLLQTPIDVYGSEHATALGAAAAARLALDPGLDVVDAPLPWTPARTFTPQWTADESGRFRAEWRAAVDADLTRRSKA
ncbi:carbohydrate kinase [Aeromicrobium phragmitis]|uniref:ATP:glycerol 3-phosphotransferase n=1 Tax=Aeromicrobium phragmitis TaxID=2478914 RepID=A0A3L8PP20_9ACTN|nr:FGGY family carbohydrate kinase [Aeromicrobium phragmitis]RLV57127.1 carbohydrate kinase [Aeromicrobium phragmitis]